MQEWTVSNGIFDHIIMWLRQKHLCCDVSAVEIGRLLERSQIVCTVEGKVSKSCHKGEICCQWPER